MIKIQNMAWLGPTGCGKTGLATSFMNQAIDRGYTSLFILFPELVDELYALGGRPLGTEGHQAIRLSGLPSCR